jgi:hypothetical protein
VRSRGGMKGWWLRYELIGGVKVMLEGGNLGDRCPRWRTGL